MRRFIRASLCIPCLLGPGAVHGGREKPVPVKVKEHVLVQRVVWPVLVDVHPRRGKPGDCENLAPGRIVVKEDGEPALVESVNREPRPTIHVILLDVSGSMAYSGWLDETREAAKRYISWLRRDERVMVFTFSDDLVLHVPLTTLERVDARAQVERAIDRIEARRSTALRDALFQVIRGLDAYPERKVILLLSDGWDTGSLQPASKVRGLAATTADLAIFPIAVELPKSLLSPLWRPLPRSYPRPGGDASNPPGAAARGRTFSPPASPPAGPASDPRPFLKDLVANSGGEYFELRDLAKLGETFQRVRDRLDREVYVTYVPLPFRDGPRDPEDEPYTFRKVEIQSLDPRCVVKAARRERFVAGEPPAPAMEVRPRDSRKTLEGVLPLPSRVTIPPPAGWADRSVGTSFLLLDQGGVLGQTTDILEEWGTIFDYLGGEDPRGPFLDRAYRRWGPVFEYRLNEEPAEGPERFGTDEGATDKGGRSPTASEPSPGGRATSAGAWGPQRTLRFQSSSRSPQEARFGPRRFRLSLPSLEQTLHRSVTRAEDVLLDWLLNGIELELPEGREQEGRIRSIVHGQTIQELAPFLAMAIFDHYPDYRSWAQARLRRDIEREIRQVFPEQPEDLIQSLVASRLDEPTPERLQPYLAGWLADFHAADLVRSLERRTINELLRISPEHLPVAEEVADRVERAWVSLRFWFRPPEHVRIVTPLFLFHDEERDVIGFIRILLPQASWSLGWGAEPPSRTVPEHPRALRLVRWMLNRPNVCEEVRGRWQLEDFRCRDAPRSEIVGRDRGARKAKREGRPETLVEVSLSWRPAFSKEAPVPSVIKVYVEEDGGSWQPVCWSADLNAPLGTALARAGLPQCAGGAN